MSTGSTASAAGAVHPIADEALANTSYVVDLGRGLAAVVDPRRDADVYLERAERLGLRIVAVLETHLHADFVTGSPELAEATSAEVVAPREAELAFGHRGIGGGDGLAWGDSRFGVLATPGHTPEHVSYVLEAEGGPAGVFSGGSLIGGGAARTDLISPDRTEELTRAQFHSVRALAELPDGAALWPTHGAGSFCSAGPSSAGETTIGEQRRVNPLLAVDDEDEFVRRVLAGYGSYPPYFLELRAVNRAGPPLLRDLEAPRPLAAGEVAESMERGAHLVDARPIDRWARAHPRRAVSIQLRPAFASWLGWVVPFDAPVVLLIDEADVAEAVTLARRIGYDSVLGWIDGGVDAWSEAGLPLARVDDVDAAEAARRAEAGAALVDVRQEAELASARMPGAVHLELGDIAAGEVPAAEEAVTFCGHGERSATAASLLEARGVAVANLVGGLPAWERAGLPVER